MDEWHAPKSDIRIILGLVFIVAGFIWMAFFYNYMALTYPKPPDKFIAWFGVMITVFLFFLSFSIGFSINTKKALISFLFLLIWSYGFLLIPVPEGYGEAVLGSWAVFGMILIALYAKYEKYRKKKVQLEKDAERK